jgi:hypothetical protein
VLLYPHIRQMIDDVTPLNNVFVDIVISFIKIDYKILIIQKYDYIL